MPTNNDRYRLGYGASNYNPDAGSGAVSIGRVGNSVRDLSGRSFGSGVGVRLNMPLGVSGGTYKPDIKGVKPTEKMAKGGSVKKMAKGGSTASKRADGCATKGKTKGRFV